MSQILVEVARNLNKALVNELRDQGHYLTGALERSINTSFRVVERSKATELIGFALDYAQDLETGLRPKQFGRSHVNELFKYFLLRGLNQVQAMEAAILTNRRHIKEGMPTKDSSRFSKTGERKNFISNAWEKSEKNIDNYVSVESDKMFEKEFTKQKSETI